MGGLITVAGKPEALRKVVAAFREGGGEGKPLYNQVALSYAKTDAEAATTAYREWRQAGVRSAQLADLRTPDDVAAACEAVSEADLCESLRVSCDLGRHAAWLAADIELGFSAIYLHNVGRNQKAFVEAFATSYPK